MSDQKYADKNLCYWYIYICYYYGYKSVNDGNGNGCGGIENNAKRKELDRLLCSLRVSDWNFPIGSKHRFVYVVKRQCHQPIECECLNGVSFYSHVVRYLLHTKFQIV